MKQYIPENLDIDELLIENPPSNIPKFDRDKLVHILHLVSYIPAINKDLEIVDGFVPIYSRILKKRVPDYPGYFKYLLQNGILQTDGSYIPAGVNEKHIGGKSKGYRFTTKYRTGLQAVTITNRTLIKHQRADSKYTKEMKKSVAHLLRWLDDGLQIDYEQAMKFITADRDRKLANPELQDIDLKTGKAKDPVTQYMAAQLSINNIADGELPAKLDNNVYRLHTPLTNMRSELRHFLNYNGLPLCSIDVKNCQPYLSTVLLLTGFWLCNNSETINIKSIKNTSIIKNLQPQDYISYIMCLKSDVIQAGIDFERYTDIATQGMFYEELEKMMSSELGIDYATRKAVKTAMFMVLYSDNRFIAKPEAAPKKFFKDIFPAVYHLFSLIKKGDKTKLPRLLQQIESHLMLKVITRRIAAERPDVPLFTIHDSIATTVGNEKYVQKVMAEELYKAIGHKPKFSVEYWKPENVRFNDKKLFVGEELLAA
ncbi:hypothetical protein [Aridibaculum aurantiacum]|uniref:hypothetical protein n=1 Tax=Aridibaculum aurantiacum TaxID=2810307 RepID=UPI001A95D12D|nr:hypothetical protein [Aridibaculum aurantiacum]